MSFWSKVNRTFNPVKNSFQYMVGSILYFLVFNEINFTKFFLGLVGFIIAYQAVYQYNDLMDYKDDVKDKFRKNKPLAKGEFKREEVETFSFLFPIIGLSICFFVDVLLGFLVALTLFLNFLHSSPFIRLKKTMLVLPNLFLTEVIKYSLGWIVLSPSLINFPYLIVISLSLAYIGGYVYYKQDANDFFKSKTLNIITVTSIILYTICFFIYPFKLMMLIPLPILFLFGVIRRFNTNIFKKIDFGSTMIYFVIISFFISILLLPNPSVAEMNNNLNKEVNKVKENITKVIPEDIKTDLKNITETITKIDDLNISLKQPFNW